MLQLQRNIVEWLVICNFSLTLSGIPNVVYTGVIINYSGKIKSFTEVSKVYMVPLTDEEIKAYVDTAEPMYEL